MATICKKCGGIIPDVVFGGNRNDCKKHIKPEINIKYKKSFLRTSK